MEIRILKNVLSYNNEIMSDGTIVEKELYPTNYNKIKRMKLYNYNSNSNSRYEICPSIVKYDLAKFMLLNMNKDEIYFCGYKNTEDEDTKNITLYRYNVLTKSCEAIYTYEDDITLYDGYKRLKIFALNKDYIIVEFEIMRSNYSDTYSGYIDFEIYLYSIKDKRKIEIYDENLVNNGISTMIPINDNSCLMKTGFSLLKDKRYLYLTKEEGSVEGISIINPSQLISDILLMKKNIMFDVFDQTYYTSTIPFADINGDYIIYSKVDTKKKEEELIFYNIKTGLSKNCIKRNVTEDSKLTKHYVINNIPYILINTKEKTELYNVEKNMVDIRLDKNEKIVNIQNDIICTKHVKISKIFGNTIFVNIYKAPKCNVLLKEKANAKEVFVSDNIIYVIAE